MDLIIGLVVGILSYGVGYLFGRFCESQDNPVPVETLAIGFRWIRRAQRVLAAIIFSIHPDLIRQ
jgi:hypothetical protein